MSPPDDFGRIARAVVQRFGRMRVVHPDNENYQVESVRDDGRLNVRKPHWPDGVTMAAPHQNIREARGFGASMGVRIGFEEGDRQRPFVAGLGLYMGAGASQPEVEDLWMQMEAFPGLNRACRLAVGPPDTPNPESPTNGQGEMLTDELDEEPFGSEDRTSWIAWRGVTIPNLTHVLALETVYFVNAATGVRVHEIAKSGGDIVQTWEINFDEYFAEEFLSFPMNRQHGFLYAYQGGEFALATPAGMTFKSATGIETTPWPADEDRPDQDLGWAVGDSYALSCNWPMKGDDAGTVDVRAWAINGLTNAWESSWTKNYSDLCWDITPARTYQCGKVDRNEDDWFEQPNHHWPYSTEEAAWFVGAIADSADFDDDGGIIIG